MYSSSYRGQSSHQSSYQTGKTVVEIALRDSPELRKLYEDNKWRMNPARRRVPRYRTGIASVDRWLGGGLPSGLVIAYGSAGSGKSLFCRQVAIHAQKALYIACEVVGDAPPHDRHPNVKTVDFTAYTPRWDHALKILAAFYVYERPSVIIIDSITSFLGVTKKAVPEAELRTSIGLIHRIFDRVVPIIGVSEVRSGFNEYPAGGSGVAHANSMLLHFSKFPIRFKSETDIYALSPGDTLYTVEVEKDKGGVARTDVAEVTYDPQTGRYEWASLRETVAMRKRQAGGGPSGSMPLPAPPPPLSPASEWGGARIAQPVTTPPPPPPF